MNFRLHQMLSDSVPPNNSICVRRFPNFDLPKFVSPSRCLPALERFKIHTILIDFMLKKFKIEIFFLTCYLL